MTSSKALYALSCLWVLISLFLAASMNQSEFFGASGSVMVLVGALLPARTYFRLGPQKYFEAKQTFDGGTFGEPSPEEITAANEAAKDFHAYRVSFPILIVGTLIWAYGAWVMKLFGYQ